MSYPRKSRLSKNEYDLLLGMRRDNDCAGSPFAPTEDWKKFQKHHEDNFHKEGIENPEASDFNLGYAGFAPRDPRLYYYFVHQLYSRIKIKDTFNLLKTVPAHVPPTKDNILKTVELGVEIDGNILSTDILLSIDTIYSLYEADPRILTENVVVADLGGGWGRIGYVLKKANPKASYHIFDIPESLLVSSVYLPKILPGEKISDYHAGAGKESISKEYLQQYGLGFWGSQKLGKLEDGALDYFINIASFQEMSRDQVKQYLNIVDKKLNGVCYLLQLRDKRIHGLSEAIIGGLLEYDFPPRWEKLFIRDSIIPNVYFESCHKV